MPYGKPRPENRFRNETAFFIGQMEVQIRVNQSVTDGEYGIYGFYSFRGSQGVTDESLDRTERWNTGIEDTPGWLSLRKRRYWEYLCHVH